MGVGVTLDGMDAFCRSWTQTSSPATCVEKGGHMIILQNQKGPLSTDFFMDKMTLFFSKR